MANVYVESRAKGRPEGKRIDDYVVEDKADLCCGGQGRPCPRNLRHPKRSDPVGDSGAIIHLSLVSEI
jgi:hypothetical protein